MKKIDLHIHTIATCSDDQSFTFDMEVLTNYVESAKLNCIAITNHNTFDEEQFTNIQQKISIEVLPGIEIDLEGGHILLIADSKRLINFADQCRQVEQKIKSATDSITLDELKSIFSDLSQYILIPHYYKDPSIKSEILDQLAPFITAREAASPKKFISCINDSNPLAPVLFSDLRAGNALTIFPTRQTYIDIGDVTFSALKNAFKDKNKVFLSMDEGHKFFDALHNGLRLSTGLNVILGQRATGKSVTLDKLAATFDGVKYIKQFSLMEKKEEEDIKKFNELLANDHGHFSDKHLRELKLVIEDVRDIKLENDDKNLENYLTYLIKSASETEKENEFSKCALYKETFFTFDSNDNLQKIIKAAALLVDNTSYKEIINSIVPIASLKKLVVALINKYNEEAIDIEKKKYANEIIAEIKSDLKVKSALPIIPNIDLFRIAMNKEKIKKFEKIVGLAKQAKTLNQKSLQGYTVVAKSRPFKGSGELKKISKSQKSFAEAFECYPQGAYKFLKSLRRMTEEGLLNEADYSKYFVHIEYKVLNKNGIGVSGGERSEFRLLREIEDAEDFEMLLIDEPESSFDNLFLMNKVNTLIKDISQNTPVVLVTHNSTVGASIKPDYIIYTHKYIEDGQVNYQFFSGRPSDKYLVDIDGSKFPNHDILLNCLEAGENTYIERGEGYESIKN